MKKSLVAVALLGTFAASAFAAPSVTLYGKVDLGVHYAHTDLDNGADATDAVTMKSGWKNGSRWGLKGTEDLGSFKVGFGLESGFNADDGRSAQGSRLFGRLAALNLQTAYGTFYAGRFGSVMSDTGPLEMLGMTSPFGSSFTDLGAHGSTGSAWTRYDNSLGYASPAFGGLKFNAMYSMKGDSKANGEENKSSATRYASAGLQGKWGALNTVLAGDYTMYGNEDTDADNGWGVLLGANYDFGPVITYGKATYFKNSLDALDSFGMFNGIPLKGWGVSLGAKVPTSVGNFLAEIGYRDAKGEDAAGNDHKFKRANVTLGYDYAFSKRTTFYATTGYVVEKNKFADTKPSTYMIGTGLVHSF